MRILAKEIFSRCEVKYTLSTAQKDILINAISEYMDPDKYNIGGKFYTISNIYYDTDDNYLIQKSAAKPKYKEKLRLRGYGVPKPGDLVFLEIKKKFKGVVNKRRTRLEIEEAKKNISDVLFKAELQAKQILEDAKTKAIEERQEIDAQIEAEKEKLIDAKIELAMLKDKAKDVMAKFTEDITSLQ